MRKFDWVLLLIILISFSVGIAVSADLPEQIPSHWNIHGEVDSYMSKSVAIFLFPGISLGIFLLMLLLPKIDPRKENYQKFKRIYAIIRIVFVIFFTIIYLLVIMYSLNKPDETPFYLQINFIVPFLVSILFIILGNYLGKIKDNFFVGIRTPWTLSSKTVWNKTHRLGGKLFVLSGVLGLIGSIIGGYVAFIMLIVPILVSTVVLVVYSYVIFSKVKDK